MSDEKAQAAWSKIEQLGGDCLWEVEMCVISLNEAGVSDGDLAVFTDFPHVDTLDLSNNPGLTDACIPHIVSLPRLEGLILVNTSITDRGITKLTEALPNTEITTEPPDPNTINPFTGEPFD